MPKDDWANLKSKERGQRAFRSGEYETRTDKGSGAMPAKAIPAMPAALAPIKCPCGHSDNRLVPQRIRGGQTVARVECKSCGKFLKFVKKKHLRTKKT